MMGKNDIQKLDIWEKGIIVCVLVYPVVNTSKHWMRIRFVQRQPQVPSRMQFPGPLFASGELRWAVGCSHSKYFLEQVPDSQRCENTTCCIKSGFGFPIFQHSRHDSLGLYVQTIVI